MHITVKIFNKNKFKEYHRLRVQCIAKIREVEVGWSLREFLLVTLPRLSIILCFFYKIPCFILKLT